MGFKMMKTFVMVVHKADKRHGVTGKYFVVDSKSMKKLAVFSSYPVAKRASSFYNKGILEPVIY